MMINEIPLFPENQRLSIFVIGRSLQMAVTWRTTFWCLDIMDSSDADLIKGIPLITSAGLPAQHHYLEPGFLLYMGYGNQPGENPTEADLDIYSHLYVAVE